MHNINISNSKLYISLTKLLQEVNNKNERGQGMAQANEGIRQYARKRKVFLWEVAKAFGVTDSHFSRRLRSEFTPEETEQAMRYIDEIAEARS